MSDAATQIVATWHNLFVLRGDEVLEDLSEAQVGHYGVTWNQEHLFALFADATVLDGSHQVIRVFDRHLKPVRDLLDGEIGGVHQITWRDGYLWITSTNTDAVVVADDQGTIQRRWYPADDPEHLGQHHINSIWFEAGCVHTLAHGLQNGEPAIYRHSYPALERVAKIPVARGGHNVFRNGRYLYLVSGGISQPDRPPCKLAGAGMIKGLSVTGERVYVGSSRVIDDRQTRRSDPVGLIWELDRQFDVVARRDLNAGPVNEIRTLDRPDLAHHQRPWTGKFWRDITA